MFYQEGLPELALISLDKEPMLTLYRFGMGYLMIDEKKNQSFTLGIRLILLTSLMAFLTPDYRLVVSEFVVFFLQNLIIKTYRDKFTICESYLLASFLLDYFKFKGVEMFEYLARIVLLLTVVSIFIIHLMNKIKSRQFAFWGTFMLLLKINFFVIKFLLEARGDSIAKLAGEIMTPNFGKYFFTQLFLTLLIIPIQYFNGPKIIQRKLFHFQIVLILYTGLQINLLYTQLALATFIWLFLVTECLRQCYLNEIYACQWLTVRLLQYCDDRDNAQLIKTHFYLIMGVSHSVFYSNNPLSGAIVLGIGDSFAAIVGSQIGRIKIKWTKKTLEGSVAFFLSCMLFEYVVNDQIRFIYIIPAIIEAVTYQ
ncbi:hypothetical protein pb186bvf_006627 [Paramecium bursaria]